MDQRKQGYMKFNEVDLDLLKKAIQILLPISLFSVLFSQPYMLDGLIHIFYNYRSLLSVKFIDCKAERNYAFLLFNGLLALIIKNSGLISDKMANISQLERPANFGDLLKQKTEAAIRKDGVTAMDDEEEDDKCGNITLQDVSPTSAAADADENDNDEEEEVEEEEEEEEEEDEDEEQGGEVELPTSDEEFHRKCDDFIKKMRKGMKIDSNLHQELR